MQMATKIKLVAIIFISLFFLYYEVLDASRSVSIGRVKLESSCYIFYWLRNKAYLDASSHFEWPLSSRQNKS